MSINWLTHPWEELSNLRHSIDETLRNWTDSAPSAASSMDWGWKPRMDVCENKGYYKVILELPNFRREDLDVQVNGRFLSIKGQRMDHSSDEWKFHRRERYSGGEFHRAVALPEGIDASSIQAKFQNGVLVLLIPKTGGKNTQHISLMGSEEHSSRRNIIEMEEQERRRRMEENDPMLSRSSWIAGRGVRDDVFSNRKVSRFEDASFRKSSIQDLKLVKSLEQKERERRIKDVKGENEKKKNAQKVSRYMKSLGMNPRSTLRRGGKQLEKIIHLEEKERQARIKDKGRQRQHQALAKRTSNLIKSSGGQSKLRHTGFNYATITKGYNNNNNYKRDLIFDRFGRENNSFGSFNLNKFNKFGNGGMSFSKFGNHPFNEFTHNLEEKERERRLRDKKGQNDAKRLAARISHMIGNANF
ncbi:hypothetical protein DICPUDRAFT_51067 [Dictyostelium purpureum]|uniref:SHSP domain-containing protein n=1 Tax=Dictyostelium purpureum TaxID=5786 RepID=F1A1S6_DICPU|nr:uncharacterized protein DICPUDRAFT_51067 [Dictyostelium purpureum]EGC29846.1 hypothetical protein DICPUDRAFT_51067 [Dictyostelium purpureum]|eukprot:XP_003293620.1 hypothetical protein DICPUDRAFT_51067 [Dictyostelium purpureum]